MNFKKQQKLNLKRGFTLIELLVTIVIFVILTGVVLVNQNGFNSAELLNNFAYDMVLTIKQAQSYGVNVQENVQGLFNAPYGVYFNTNTSNQGSRTSFVLFDDLTGINGPDFRYTNDKGVTTCPTNNPECVQKYTIKNGLYIKDICVGSDENSCNRPENELSILFKRPNLEALIYSDFTGTSGMIRYQYAKITLASQGGATTSVVVTDPGQIYIKR
jgi:prepilin-type N-terminal cleavage/methylation domain-containing protein